MQITGEQLDVGRQLASVLQDAYGITDVFLERLPLGQATLNYRAVGQDQTVFVKRYLAGTALDEERRAIELSEIARRAGIPAAPIRAASNGHYIVEAHGFAISVWDWMPGSTKSTQLTIRQHEEVGIQLGRIHRIFRNLRTKNMSIEKTNRWLDPKIEKLRLDIKTLQDLVATRLRIDGADEFDRAAEAQLAKRMDDIARLPGLIEGLPALNSQVLHGDYTLVNLLMEKETVSAVLDFRPPEAFLVAYDLGRVAFQPSVVVGDANWLEGARALIRSYADANREVSAVDLKAAGRVALIQLLRSLYGIKQHYSAPALLQANLDKFWTDRHEAVSILFQNFKEIDDV